MRQGRDNFELCPVIGRYLLSVFFLSNLLWGQEVPSNESTTAKSPLRVGKVNIQSLFRDYRKTLLAEQEIGVARADIQKESQLAQNQILERRRIVEKRLLSIREGKASDELIAEMRRELPIYNQELKRAEAAKNAEREQATKKLNQQMMGRMAGILKEIIELVAQRAETEGYDLVIDISGKNSNQMLPILYTRDAVDLTEMMKKELSKGRERSR